MLYAYIVQNRWFTLRSQAVAQCRAIGLPLTAIKRRRIKIDRRVALAMQEAAR